MSSSKAFHSQTFTPYRPLTTKSIPFSSSIKTQSINEETSSTKPSTIEHDLFSTVRHENSLLREENRALKKELQMMKGDFLESHSLRNISSGSHDYNDLRETIKKEAGEIKELKTRLEIVSKQSRMYEEIIDKMENKINKLTDQNRSLELKFKEKPVLHYRNQESIPVMSEKVHEILSMYMELESEVHEQDKEWECWKEQWGKEKSYYLNRIRDLEGMMGIGVENKESNKKRF